MFYFSTVTTVKGHLHKRFLMRFFIVLTVQRKFCRARSSDEIRTKIANVNKQRFYRAISQNVSNMFEIPAISQMKSLLKNATRYRIKNRLYKRALKYQKSLTSPPPPSPDINKPPYFSGTKKSSYNRRLTSQILTMGYTKC